MCNHSEPAYSGHRKKRTNWEICDLDLSVVSALGVVVAMLTAFSRQLGFEEKWGHNRKTAETMRNEGDDYFALAGKYEKFGGHQEAFKTFITYVTSFKRHEVESYIEDEKKRKKEGE